MKKTGKLMLGALSILAATSCVNDDILGIGGGADSLKGKQTLTVELADIEEGAATRSGVTYNASGLVWQDGDKMRVYDGGLSKYATFTYNREGDAFVNPNSKVDKKDATYVLFPGDKVLYTNYNEKDDYLTAVMDLDDEWKYDTFTAADNETNGYYSNVPLFAAVTNITEEGNLTSRGRMLAGLLRIKVSNGKGSPIQRIVVESLAGEGEGAEAKPIAGRFEALLKVNEAGEVAEDATLVPTEDEFMKETLKRKITVVTGENGKLLGERNSYVFVPIVPETYDKLKVTYYASENDDTGKEIATLENVVSEANSILYTLNGKEKVYVSNLAVNFETTEENVTYPGELQAVLEKAAAKNLPMTINVNMNNNSPIQVGDATNLEWYTTVVVPQLPKDITLNIYGPIKGNTDASRLIIKSAEGADNTGKLTINNVYKKDVNAKVTLPIDITGYKGGLVLKSEGNFWYENEINVDVDGALELNGYIGSKAKLNITKVGDLTLSGTITPKEVSVKQTGNVTLKDLKHNYSATNTSLGVLTTVKLDKAEDVIVENTERIDVVIGEATGDVTVNNAKNMGITVEKAATVTIDGVNNNDEAKEEQEKFKNVVVKSAATVNVGTMNHVYITVDDADVNMTKDTYYTTLTVKKGEVDVKGMIYSVVVSEGSLDITDVAVTEVTTGGATVTIDAKEKTFNKLTLDAPATINLNNGGIKDIIRNYDYKKGTTKVAVVNSTGKSYIKTVDKVEEMWMNFYSEWTGETVGQAGCNWGGVENEIYTAAQFGTNSTYSTNEGTYIVYTDIDMTKAKFSPLLIKKGITMQGVQRDDKSWTTISNVKISEVSSFGQFGLFKQMSTTGSGVTTIKDLVIDGISVEVSPKAETASISEVGGLIGCANSDLNVENVTIKGNNSIVVGGTSEKIGGLIGSVKQGVKVNIKDTKVAMSKIAGYKNLGGTIGYVEGEVTIANSPNTIQSFEVFDRKLDRKTVDKDGWNEDYGRVGMVVGSIGAEATKVQLGTTTYKELYTLNPVSGNKGTYHFDYNFKYDTTNGDRLEFTGGLAAVGYSPEVGDEVVKYGNASYKTDNALINKRVVKNL